MIGFRMPKIIRRLLRRKTRHVADEALMKRDILLFACTFVAWNGLGYCAYQHYTGPIKKKDPDKDKLTRARWYGRFAGAKNVTWVRVEGLTYVSSKKLENEEEGEPPHASADRLDAESGNLTEDFSENTKD